MSTAYNQRPDENQRRQLLRTLLLLPPFALVATALLLILASPFSWGAAAVIDAPGWMPPALGIIVGACAFWVGWYALKRIARATAGDFEVFGLQTAFGLLMFISGTVLLLRLLSRLPSEATYRSALDDEGQMVTSALGYFAFSLIFGLLQVGWVWAGAYLYSHAISNQQPTRLSARRPNEVDGIGQMLRERD